MKSSILARVALAVTSMASPFDAGAAGRTAPPEVLEQASAYLASQAGERYAAQNYVPVPGQCRVKTHHQNVSAESDCDRAAGDGASIEAYILDYEYVPWVKIGALDARVSVRVPVPTGEPSGYVGTFDAAGRIVEPRVTRPEAEAKMRAAVPDSTLLAPLSLVVPGRERSANPVWWGSFPIGAERGGSQDIRRVGVDAVSGEIVIEPDTTLSAHE